MSPANPKRLEWLRRVALLLGAPLLMLALFEYLLWTFDVAPPDVEADPGARIFNTAGLTEKLSGQDPNRFICLGASTVAGAPFERRLNMCTIMERSMAGPELVNLASSAQDSNDILARARAACKVKSRLVYAYFGHNEFLHLERWALFRPPESMQAAGRFFSRFRFFRLLQRLLAPQDPRGTDFDIAALTDAEVYAHYEANYRALLEACRDTRLVISTVVANPDLGFPASGMSLRETWRTYGAFQSVPMTKSCRHCFRAGPEINRTIRRLAEEYKSDNLMLVDVEDLAPPGRGPELFWDHCHPKPALHEAIARRTLEALRQRGWIEGFGPVRHDLSPQELSAGRIERAVYLLQYDPPQALLELNAIPADELPEPDGPPLLARIVAAFVLDDRAELQRGLLRLHESVRAPTRRAGIESCLNSGAQHTFCVPWRRGVLVNDAEKAELVQLARELDDDLIARLLDQL